MAVNRTYHFIGSCVGNPFPNTRELCHVIDRSIEISKRTFLEHCHVLEDQRQLMHRFPNSYTYYRSRYHKRYIYFFENSRIEYFFAEGGELNVKVETQER